MRWWRKITEWWRARKAKAEAARKVVEDQARQHAEDLLREARENDTHRRMQAAIDACNAREHERVRKLRTKRETEVIDMWIAPPSKTGPSRVVPIADSEAEGIRQAAAEQETVESAMSS